MLVLGKSILRLVWLAVQIPEVTAIPLVKDTKQPFHLKLHLWFRAPPFILASTISMISAISSVFLISFGLWQSSGFRPIILTLGFLTLLPAIPAAVTYFAYRSINHSNTLILFDTTIGLIVSIPVVAISSAAFARWIVAPPLLPLQLAAVLAGGATFNSIWSRILGFST